MLTFLIIGMWAMLLTISAFLVLVVAPIEAVTGETPMMAVSGFQTATAIAAVVLFVFALNRLKRIYVNRKLPQI